MGTCIRPGQVINFFRQQLGMVRSYLTTFVLFEYAFTCLCDIIMDDVQFPFSVFGSSQCDAVH